MQHLALLLQRKEGSKVERNRGIEEERKKGQRGKDRERGREGRKEEKIIEEIRHLPWT